MLTAALFIAGAYLWGAIPSAYLAGRYLKGIDIRRYGSGNIGAANVMSQVGKGTGWLIGTFDCLGKGALPVFLAAYVFEESLAIQVATGLAAIAGHNWSPYIRFTGGRGVAPAVGVVFGFQMWWEFLILTVVMGAIGRLLFRETAFWTFVSILLLPLLAFLFDRFTPVDRSPEVLYMTLGIAVLLLAKRLTANWERPPNDAPLIMVLMYRLLWDRDVARQTQWTERRPQSETERPSSDVADEQLP